MMLGLMSRWTSDQPVEAHQGHAKTRGRVIARIRATAAHIYSTVVRYATAQIHRTAEMKTATGKIHTSAKG